MKRIHLLGALAGLALALPLAATSSRGFPDHIDLPNGWQPEGIAIGRGTNFYVGSIPTGRIYRGDLRTGQGAELVPDRGRRAIGVEVDHRNRLCVAGGPTGDGYVYNASTGADIAQFNFTDVGDVRERRRGHEAGGVVHRLDAPVPLQGADRPQRPDRDTAGRCR